MSRRHHGRSHTDGGESGYAAGQYNNRAGRRPPPRAEGGLKITATDTAPLAAGPASMVLDWLAVPAGRPDRALLDALVQAYRVRVPWDTTTRIVKRVRTAETAACPRWPAEFWGDAIERGSGGTCYESNYALFSLLRALGYEGYLTLNDMRDVARRPAMQRSWCGPRGSGGWWTWV